MKKTIGAALLALAMHAPLLAQPRDAAAATNAIDPARLAAARALIDVLMPPATREQMIIGMMTPMLANIRQGFVQNAHFNAAMDSDKRIRAMFDSFIAQQEKRTTDLMRQALPGMFPAMANAYARRFDLQQLRDIRAFFETPTSRTYMQASLTIMSDPDIATWQRRTMAMSMQHVQADAAAFGKQIAALASPEQ